MHRDAPGKQRRGESDIRSPTRVASSRAASILTLEMAGATDLDDNTPAGDKGERMEGPEGGGEDRVSAEENSGDEETLTPSELARSLGADRPTLQRIRHRLHGDGTGQGITHKVQALLLWISLQVAHMGEADPVVLLSNIGGGEREGAHKASRKAKRVTLTSFQTPRFHQGMLNLGTERGEQEGEHEGREEEGEQRGRAKPRTNPGIRGGGGGGEGDRGSKRKSELSSSQPSSWRQLSLNFGGGDGGGQQSGGGGEEEGDIRGQKRTRSSQLEPSVGLIRPEPAPGTDRSDGRGPPSGLV